MRKFLWGAHVEKEGRDRVTGQRVKLSGVTAESSAAPESWNESSEWRSRGLNAPVLISVWLEALPW